MMQRAVLAGAAVILASTIAMADDRMSAAIGRGLFKRVWVPAPSSTRANDGLGPLFNGRSCLSCHQGLDRMPPVTEGDVLQSQHIVIRFSDADGKPDAAYGAQLQTSAIQGHTPEGQVVLQDGVPEASGLAFGPLAETTQAGGRDAPMLRGLGQLADVPDSAILALTDPHDRDGDGIRGRANILPDGRIGRFGWKASAPGLAEQVATAFHLDLGMGTARHPAPEGDCTELQVQCRSGPHGGGLNDPEIHDGIVSMLAAYLASVKPPEGAGPDPEGEKLFAATGCAACHRPELPTATGRTIRPFTDLLLHDLGPDLDGGATEPGVASTEWRTAPLWGLSRTLAAGGGLLHDGRADSVENAIALHGGEASGARDRFHRLDGADRQRLLDYVGSL